jgi:hypothetical protein
MVKLSLPRPVTTPHDRTARAGRLTKPDDFLIRTATPQGHSAPIIHQTAIWARSATVSADTGHWGTSTSKAVSALLLSRHCAGLPGAPPVKPGVSVSF